MNPVLKEILDAISTVDGTIDLRGLARMLAGQQLEVEKLREQVGQPGGIAAFDHVKDVERELGRTNARQRNLAARLELLEDLPENREALHADMQLRRLLDLVRQRLPDRDVDERSVGSVAEELIWDRERALDEVGRLRAEVERLGRPGPHRYHVEYDREGGRGPRVIVNVISHTGVGAERAGRQIAERVLEAIEQHERYDQDGQEEVPLVTLQPDGVVPKRVSTQLLSDHQVGILIGGLCEQVRRYFDQNGLAKTREQDEPESTKARQRFSVPITLGPEVLVLRVREGSVRRATEVKDDVVVVHDEVGTVDEFVVVDGGADTMTLRMDTPEWRNG